MASCVRRLMRGVISRRYISALLTKTCRHDNMKDLRCMSFTSKGTLEILVAGCQDAMFKIDVEKGRIVEEVLRL